MSAVDPVEVVVPLQPGACERLLADLRARLGQSDWIVCAEMLRIMDDYHDRSDSRPERDLLAIQLRAIQDSRWWFPDVHRSQHDAVVHFALGIAGEVGELVNLVKKVNRGSTTFQDVAVEMQHELADVLIYLCDIATELGFDLAAVVEAKRAVLIERWGQP